MKGTSVNNFKNIIFDLGGVILNIDYNLTIEAFKKLGIEDFKNVYSKAQQGSLFDDFETGKSSPAEFIEGLLSFTNKSISPDKIIAAWNAMLLDLPEERIDLLATLRKKHRIFLLSNTNIIHYQAYSAYLQSAFGMSDFHSIFEKQYLSFEIGMRKPDREIFELVIRENNLAPAETLFIDDSIQHVEGAKLAGINAIHLTGQSTIIDIFK